MCVCVCVCGGGVPCCESNVISIVTCSEKHFSSCHLLLRFCVSWSTVLLSGLFLKVTQMISHISISVFLQSEKCWSNCHQNHKNTFEGNQYATPSKTVIRWQNNEECNPQKCIESSSKVRVNLTMRTSWGRMETQTRRAKYSNNKIN